MLNFRFFIPINWIIFTLLLIFINKNTLAYSKIELIKDSETEDMIYEIIDPIVRAAKLSKTPKIYLVNNDDLNAFADMNGNIFICTGLIGYSKDPRFLTGVLAHEIAHVALDHVSKMHEQIKNAQNASNLITSLGVLGSILSKNKDSVGLALGIMTGWNYYLIASSLQYSVMQETIADKMAVDYLIKSKYDPSGLKGILQEVANNEQNIDLNNFNPYITTHPISSKRIRQLSREINQKELPEFYYPKNFSRVAVKIQSFTGSYAKIEDECLDIYQKSIQDYKSKNYNDSIEKLNYLDRSCFKNDPYIHELIGQNFYEQKNIEESVKYYMSAYYLSNKKNENLKMDLIGIMIDSGGEKNLKEASYLLNESLSNYKFNNFYQKEELFNLVSLFFFKTNDKSRSQLALAKIYKMLKNQEMMQIHLNIAFDESLVDENLQNKIKKGNWEEEIERI